jgi:superfamily II DNA/RNA helicase
MVATDIAARGIDIAGDQPRHQLRRAGASGGLRAPHRANGRAQKVGDAFTLMNGEELGSLQAIERFIGAKIPRLEARRFFLTFTTALFEPESRYGHGQARRSSADARHGAYSYGRRRR